MEVGRDAGAETSEKRTSQRGRTKNSEKPEVHGGKHNGESNMMHTKVVEDANSAQNVPDSANMRNQEGRSECKNVHHILFERVASSNANRVGKKVDRDTEVVSKELFGSRKEPNRRLSVGKW